MYHLTCSQSAFHVSEKSKNMQETVIFLQYLKLRANILCEVAYVSAHSEWDASVGECTKSMLACSKRVNITVRHQATATCLMLDLDMRASQTERLMRSFHMCFVCSEKKNRMLHEGPRGSASGHNECLFKRCCENSLNICWYILVWTKVVCQPADWRCDPSGHASSKALKKGRGGGWEQQTMPNTPKKKKKNWASSWALSTFQMKRPGGDVAAPRNRRLSLSAEGPEIPSRRGDGSSVLPVEPLGTGRSAPPAPFLPS